MVIRRNNFSLEIGTYGTSFLLLNLFYTKYLYSYSLLLLLLLMMMMFLLLLLLIAAAPGRGYVRFRSSYGRRIRRRRGRGSFCCRWSTRP